MECSPFEIGSSVSGIGWPAVPDPNRAVLWALLYQLEQGQWWSPEVIEARRWTQLRRVLQHAYETVPFYRARFDEAGLHPSKLRHRDDFARVPILMRKELQAAGDQLTSTRIPQDHGRTSIHVTGGSTGEPVRVLGTAVTSFAWRVYTLRDHLWHRRDFSQKLAVIRFMEQGTADPPRGTQSRNWGTATQGMPTGPCAILTIHSTTEQQAHWLAEQNPAYLLTYPSAILALTRFCAKHGIALPALREVRTFGEVLEPQVREAVRETWGVPVVDSYSSEEFGYLALQCPDHPHYHVQADNVLVEVLHDDGRPCQPGEIGRVLVTHLHNFAMPLIRYFIGDYAEVGEPCSCGRNLPVLTQILGRQRNMFTLPGGETRWPMVDARDISAAFDDLPPISKFQLVQKSVEQIDVNLVVARALTQQEEETIRGYLQQGLGYAFDVNFRYVDDIPRSPRGKFEEFRSEVHLAP